jgi:hypothetical protein
VAKLQAVQDIEDEDDRRIRAAEKALEEAKEEVKAAKDWKGVKGIEARTDVRRNEMVLKRLEEIMGAWEMRLMMMVRDARREGSA